MAEPTLLDRTYSIIIKGFVETGQAPYYNEIAAELGVSPEEGRQALRTLFSIRGCPGWLYPGKTVQVDSVCLDCGEPVQVKVKDGKFESRDPEGLIGFVALPFTRWFFNVPYA